MAAKKMLRSGMSVTEAALRLSYNSDSHFISTFKKMTGITPGKFAKGKNGNNV
jgi:AraC-like DNA-binding protein